MNKMLNRTKQNVYWNYKVDRILPQSTFNEVSKFHQSSTLIKNNNFIPYYPYEVFSWLEDVENTDIVPNYYSEEIDFSNNVTKHNFKGSIRNLKSKEVFRKETLGSILYNSFGRSEGSTSKRHPSAGGLYPVLPLVCFLKENVLQDITIKPGCYLFDSTEIKLKCIREWDEIDLRNIPNLLNSYDGTIYSDIVITYAIDLKRAITKYRKRGYRHALIEVGLMAQSLRESLNDEGDYGDFCWSGFDDNALTYNLGLNVQLCPVALVQWFGKVNE
ncbi:nitroreductase family protein [Virgibacillus kimchii]